MASLRIYEPLKSFPPSQRERWLRDAIPTSRNDEQERALQRVITPERINSRADGAYVINVEGETFVAPWSTTARSIAALEEFKNSLPEPLVALFIPQGLDEALVSASRTANGIDDPEISHILTETWMVPPRWFSLFSVEDRERGHDERGPWVRMRTAMANARRHANIALQTVLSSFGPGQPASEMEELADWLELFDSGSIVECDYGGLALYLEQSIKATGGAGIEDDSSVEDIRSSLAGLAAGNGILAGVGYERLVGRWRAVAAYEHAM